MADGERVIPSRPRCPGRQPLRITPSIRRSPGWRRIAFWSAAALLALLFFVAQARSQDSQLDWQSLPQRTREVLATIALQAEVSRVAAQPSEGQSEVAFPAISCRTSGLDVAREIAAWLLDNASPELNVMFGTVQASEEAFVTWFHALMTAFSANNYGRSEEQVANVYWIERRIRLESTQSAVAWDRLLWTLISEITSDPLTREDIYFGATLIALAQFEDEGCGDAPEGR